MSYNNNNSNRGGNRWNRYDNNPRPRHSNYQSRPPPPSNGPVTDNDAIQALLSEATAREQERTGSTKRGDWDRNKGYGSSSNRPSKRSRWGESDKHHRNEGGRGSNSRGGGEQRLQENDSYYGPSRRNHSRNDRPNLVADEDETESSSKVENGDDDDKKKKVVSKPNFGLSGALAKDTATSGTLYKGVMLKFQEPPEARAPNTQWRFYVFKKGNPDILETLHISKQSAYLMGRNSDVCDIPLLHPSLSSQHAVLQYRALPNKETGKLACHPYLMDLESTNGSFLNGVKIDAARYYQLKKGDVITFGASTREYVLLTENTTSV